MNQEKSLVQVFPTAELLTDAAHKQGFTPAKVMELLWELTDWTTIKLDKNGEVHESTDGKLRLQALDLLLKATNNFGTKGAKPEDVGGLNDADLTKLEKTANKHSKKKSKK